MSKRGKAVLLESKHEPTITGYLIIGTMHYEITGRRINDIRSDLTVKQIPDDEHDARAQMDMFDGRSGQSGERKLNSP
jgi:hypothetical protein